MEILLTNDDGISPALMATIKVLEKIANVTTVVPAKNQSWTSKSNTRDTKKLIEKKVKDVDGIKITTLDALPADCSNYGLFQHDKFPDVLVTGANLGHNVGLSAFLSSGTVGSALEGLLAGVPAISVSCPYTFGEELTEEKFSRSVIILEKLVKKFHKHRPESFAMLTINLPINTENEKLIAVNMERWIFGKLFDDEDGHVRVRDYPKLNQRSENKPLTDTWARQMKYASVIALDKYAQIIDREIVADWLRSVDLYDIRAD